MGLCSLLANVVIKRRLQCMQSARVIIACFAWGERSVRVALT